MTDVLEQITEATELAVNELLRTRMSQLVIVERDTGMAAVVPETTLLRRADVPVARVGWVDCTIRTASRTNVVVDALDGMDRFIPGERPH